MKRIILSIFCIAPIINAATTKNDLEKAIRDLDVATVQQIIASEKFAQREYDPYFSLAQEVMHIREELFLYKYASYDVTTPYEGPSLGRLIAEYMGMVFFCGVQIQITSDLKMHQITKEYVFRTQQINEQFSSLPKLPEIKSDLILPEPQLSRMKILVPVVATAMVLLAGKFLYDCVQMSRMVTKHKELLRKKYDDAVTIKQLMYTANIVD